VKKSHSVKEIKHFLHLFENVFIYLKPSSEQPLYANHKHFSMLAPKTLVSTASACSKLGEMDNIIIAEICMWREFVFAISNLQLREQETK